MSEDTEETVGKVFTEEELEELARTEMNEDPEMVRKDLKALKQWIKKQPHLAKTGKQGCWKLAN